VALDETTAAFAAAAAADGITFGSRTFDWLGEQGHVGLERVARTRRDPALVAPAKAAIALLQAIYARLRGDESVLRASRENLLLPVELVHEATGTVVELTGPEHFTSFRAAALGLYTDDAPVAFDLAEHRALCAAWAGRSDGIGRGLAAKGFGFGGVQRQRAYQDSLRDLATPAMGHPPLVRIVAVDEEGGALYRRHRTLLAGLRPS
jgi:hypothetical protein